MSGAQILLLKQESNSQDSFITVEERNRIENMSLTDMSQRAYGNNEQKSTIRRKLIKLQEEIEYKKLQKLYEEQVALVKKLN